MPNVTKKILSLSNLSLFESETIFSQKIISERKKNYCYGFMPGDFQVICGSMVGENRRSPASTRTPDIIKKANSKLSKLSRLTKFMTLQKKRTLYKAFVESQFKYCPLTWMFHGSKTNYKINRLQEQALRLFYYDHIYSFDEFQLILIH